MTDLITSLLKRGYRIKLKYYNDRSEATAFEASVMKGCITQGASGKDIESALTTALERIKDWEQSHGGKVPTSYKSRTTPVP